MPVRLNGLDVRASVSGRECSRDRTSRSARRFPPAPKGRSRPYVPWRHAAGPWWSRARSGTAGKVAAPRRPHDQAAPVVRPHRSGCRNPSAQQRPTARRAERSRQRVPIRAPSPTAARPPQGSGMPRCVSGSRQDRSCEAYRKSQASRRISPPPIQCPFAAQTVSGRMRSSVSIMRRPVSILRATVSASALRKWSRWKPEGKGPPGRVDHHHLDLSPGIEPFGRSRDVLDHGHVEGVQRVVPVEPEIADLALDAERQRRQLRHVG